MTPITPSVATSGSTEVSTFTFDAQPTSQYLGKFPVRVVQIDGDPWFVAKDVCLALGVYIKKRSNGKTEANVTMACRKLGADETALNPIGGKYRVQDTRIVSESGLYKLVMRSDKPQAKKFQDWVTRDVLPTIRKTGQYNTSAEAVAKGEMSFAEMTAKVMQGLLEQVELEKKKTAKLEHRNKSLTKVNASLTDELHYVTVREFLDHHMNIYVAPGLASRLGKAATKICNENGYELRREDKELVNKGVVVISSIGVYPHEVLLEAWEKNVKHFYEAQKVHG